MVYRKYITLKWLKSQQACAVARRAFEAAFGQRAPYADVLKRLGESGEEGWAMWLLDRAAPVRDGRVYWPRRGKGCIVSLGYRNGRPHGVWKVYEDNGKLSVEEPYKDGVLHGLVKWYNADGSLWYSDRWRNGFYLGEEKI